MSSAESDKYVQNQRKLKFAGMKVESSDDHVTMAGIPVTRGPRVILCPAFAITQKEILKKIDGGRITERSSLILEGHHLTVRNLDLDGALIIRAGENTHVMVDGLVVRNKGWQLQELDSTQEYPEPIRIRGYVMNKHETLEYLLHEPGNYVIGSDGEVRKLD
jgi:UDP-sugar pyrophosphorylase